MSKLRHSKIFILLFILVSLFILSPKKVFAFQEEFDSYPLNDQVWGIYQNEGIITVSSGMINISAGNTTSYPFIFSKSNPIPTSEDFIVKFRIKYNSATTKGTGVVLATDIPQNGGNDTSLNDPLFSKRYFLEVWQDSIGGFFFAYSGDCYNASCPLDQIIVYRKGSVDLNYHDVEFRYSSNQYSIFLDNNQVFISNPTSIRPSYLWFGNPTIQGSGNTWTGFSLDYIRVEKISVNRILQPLVILPGLGASWNHENMILGIEKPQSEWFMTPGIKVYDGLVETLKNIGYKTDGNNKNLFIFNYNWTKPINLTVEDFKNYLQNVVQPFPNQKIDLIGHSLGGLIARTYLQNNQNNQIDQLITLGSPHKGVPSLYYPWEGGDLSKSLPSWQRIGAGLLIHLRKPGFSTTMEAIRSTIPSMKDLLPTFNYLKENNVEKNINQMNQKNEWLIALNNNLPNYLLLSSLNTVVGISNQNTLRWLNVTSPDWLDKILGFWIDGKPQNEEKAQGDWTVLTESGTLAGAKIDNLDNVSHMELVTSSAGQQKIIESLGLSPNLISTISAGLNYDSALVFQIASPATLNIIEPDGNFAGYGDGKLMIIPNPTNGQYQIKLTGTAKGQYQLYIGQIVNGEDIWTTTSGSINSGEKIIHKLNFNASSPLENPLIDQNGNEYIKSVRNKIFDLKNKTNQENINQAVKRTMLAQLNQIIRLLNSNKNEDAIVSLYRLRYQINLWQLTGKLDENNLRYFKNKIQEIIEDLEDAYVIIETNKGSGYNTTRLTQEIKLAQKSFEKMETKLKNLAIKNKTKLEYGVIYLIAQEKLNKALNTSSFEAHINTLGARYLSQEGLFFFK